MTLHGLGSAEAAADNGATGTTFFGGSSIVTTPVLDGDRAFKVDPVNGHPTIMTYGWGVRVDSQGRPRLMLASAIIRIEDFWDEQVALMELGVGSVLGDPTRQISIDSNAKLQISDKDEVSLGQTSTGYLATGINYFFLWLYDQRSLTDTRDMLWVWKSGAWDLAIDVTGHGAGVDDVIALTMGTHTGKGPLPTTGGPFYFVNAVLQNLLVAPNGGSAEPKDDAFGSFACKVKMPSANGTYGDFDAGTGTNPDWNDVKEIPSDDATSYDEGAVGFAEIISSNITFRDDNPDTIFFTQSDDWTPGATIIVSGSVRNDGTYTIASIDSPPWRLTLVPGDTLTNEAQEATVTITQAGDKQSYAIADAGGGEAVLAVQVVGAAFQTGPSADLTARPFIYDGASRQNLPEFVVDAVWRPLNNFDEDVTLNQINGVDLDETLFNLLEAGLEIVQVQNGAVLRVSQMAIEYAIVGSKPLPDTFPNLAPPVTEDRRRALIQQEI